MQIILENVTIIYELYQRKAKKRKFSICFTRSVDFYKNGKKKYTNILKSLKKRAKQIQKKKKKKTEKQHHNQVGFILECKTG